MSSPRHLSSTDSEPVPSTGRFQEPSHSNENVVDANLTYSQSHTLLTHVSYAGQPPKLSPQPVSHLPTSSASPMATIPASSLDDSDLPHISPSLPLSSSLSASQHSPLSPLIVSPSTYPTHTHRSKSPSTSSIASSTSPSSRSSSKKRMRVKLAVPGISPRMQPPPPSSLARQRARNHLAALSAPAATSPPLSQPLNQLPTQSSFTNGSSNVPVSHVSAAMPPYMHVHTSTEPQIHSQPPLDAHSHPHTLLSPGQPLLGVPSMGPSPSTPADVATQIMTPITYSYNHALATADAVPAHTVHIPAGPLQGYVCAPHSSVDVNAVKIESTSLQSLSMSEHPTSAADSITRGATASYDSDTGTLLKREQDHVDTQAARSAAAVGTPVPVPVNGATTAQAKEEAQPHATTIASATPTVPTAAEATVTGADVMGAALEGMDVKVKGADATSPPHTVSQTGMSGGAVPGAMSGAGGVGAVAHAEGRWGHAPPRVGSAGAIKPDAAEMGDGCGERVEGVVAGAEVDMGAKNALHQAEGSGAAVDMRDEVPSFSALMAANEASEPLHDAHSGSARDAGIHASVPAATGTSHGSPPALSPACSTSTSTSTSAVAPPPHRTHAQRAQQHMRIASGAELPASVVRALALPHADATQLPPALQHLAALYVHLTAIPRAEVITTTAAATPAGGHGTVAAGAGAGAGMSGTASLLPWAQWAILLLRAAQTGLLGRLPAGALPPLLSAAEATLLSPAHAAKAPAPPPTPLTFPVARYRCLGFPASPPPASTGDALHCALLLLLAACGRPESDLRVSPCAALSLHADNDDDNRNSHTSNDDEDSAAPIPSIRLTQALWPPRVASLPAPLHLLPGTHTLAPAPCPAPAHGWQLTRAAADGVVQCLSDICTQLLATVDARRRREEEAASERGRGRRPAAVVDEDDAVVSTAKVDATVTHLTPAKAAQYWLAARRAMEPLLPSLALALAYAAAALSLRIITRESAGPLVRVCAQLAVGAVSEPGLWSAAVEVLRAAHSSSGAGGVCAVGEGCGWVAEELVRVWVLRGVGAGTMCVELGSEADVGSASELNIDDEGATAGTCTETASSVDVRAGTLALLVLLQAGAGASQLPQLQAFTLDTPGISPEPMRSPTSDTARSRLASSLVGARAYEASSAAATATATALATVLSPLVTAHAVPPLLRALLLVHGSSPLALASFAAMAVHVKQALHAAAAHATLLAISSLLPPEYRPLLRPSASAPGVAPPSLPAASTAHSLHVAECASFMTTLATDLAALSHHPRYPLATVLLQALLALSLHVLAHARALPSHSPALAGKHPLGVLVAAAQQVAAAAASVLVQASGWAQSCVALRHRRRLPGEVAGPDAVDATMSDLDAYGLPVSTSTTTTTPASASRPSTSVSAGASAEVDEDADAAELSSSDSEAEVVVDTDEVRCVCQEGGVSLAAQVASHRADVLFVDCDDCHYWFHGPCVGIRSVADIAARGGRWLCDGCAVRRAGEQARQRVGAGALSALARALTGRQPARHARIGARYTAHSTTHDASNTAMTSVSPLSSTSSPTHSTEAQSSGGVLPERERRALRQALLASLGYEWASRDAVRVWCVLWAAEEVAAAEATVGAAEATAEEAEAETLARARARAIAYTGADASTRGGRGRRGATRAAGHTTPHPPGIDAAVIAPPAAPPQDEAVQASGAPRALAFLWHLDARLGACAAALRAGESAAVARGLLGSLALRGWRALAETLVLLNWEWSGAGTPHELIRLLWPLALPATPPPLSLSLSAQLRISRRLQAPANALTTAHSLTLLLVNMATASTSPTARSRVLRLALPALAVLPTLAATPVVTSLLLQLVTDQAASTRAIAVATLATLLTPPSTSTSADTSAVAPLPLPLLRLFAGLLSDPAPSVRKQVLTALEAALVDTRAWAWVGASVDTASDTATIPTPLLLAHAQTHSLTLPDLSSDAAAPPLSLAFARGALRFAHPCLVPVVARIVLLVSEATDAVATAALAVLQRLWLAPIGGPTRVPRLSGIDAPVDASLFSPWTRAAALHLAAVSAAVRSLSPAETPSNALPRVLRWLCGKDPLGHRPAPPRAWKVPDLATTYRQHRAVLADLAAAAQEMLVRGDACLPSDAPADTPDLVLLAQWPSAHTPPSWSVPLPSPSPSPCLSDLPYAPPPRPAALMALLSDIAQAVASPLLPLLPPLLPLLRTAVDTHTVPALAAVITRVVPHISASHARAHTQLAPLVDALVHALLKPRALSQYAAAAAPALAAAWSVLVHRCDARVAALGEMAVADGAEGASTITQVRTLHQAVCAPCRALAVRLWRLILSLFTRVWAVVKVPLSRASFLRLPDITSAPPHAHPALPTVPPLPPTALPSLLHSLVLLSELAAAMDPDQLAAVATAGVQHDDTATTPTSNTSTASTAPATSDSGACAAEPLPVVACAPLLFAASALAEQAAEVGLVAAEDDTAEMLNTTTSNTAPEPHVEVDGEAATNVSAGASMDITSASDQATASVLSMLTSSPPPRLLPASLFSQHRVTAALFGVAHVLAHACTVAAVAQAATALALSCLRPFPALALALTRLHPHLTITTMEVLTTAGAPTAGAAAHTLPTSTPLVLFLLPPAAVALHTSTRASAPSLFSSAPRSHARTAAAHTHAAPALPSHPLPLLVDPLTLALFSPAADAEVTPTPQHALSGDQASLPATASTTVAAAATATSTVTPALQALLRPSAADSLRASVLRQLAQTLRGWDAATGRLQALAATARAALADGAVRTGDAEGAAVERGLDSDEELVLRARTVLNEEALSQRSAAMRLRRQQQAEATKAAQATLAAPRGARRRGPRVGRIVRSRASVLLEEDTEDDDEEVYISLDDSSDSDGDAAHNTAAAQPSIPVESSDSDSDSDTAYTLLSPARPAVPGTRPLDLILAFVALAPTPARVLTASRWLGVAELAHPLFAPLQPLLLRLAASGPLPLRAAALALVTTLSATNVVDPAQALVVLLQAAYHPSLSSQPLLAALQGMLRSPASARVASALLLAASESIPMGYRVDQDSAPSAVISTASSTSSSPPDAWLSVSTDAACPLPLPLARYVSLATNAPAPPVAAPAEGLLSLFPTLPLPHTTAARAAASEASSRVAEPTRPTVTRLKRATAVISGAASSRTASRRTAPRPPPAVLLAACLWGSALSLGTSVDEQLHAELAAEERHNTTTGAAVGGVAAAQDIRGSCAAWSVSTAPESWAVAAATPRTTLRKHPSVFADTAAERADDSGDSSPTSASATATHATPTRVNVLLPALFAPGAAFALSVYTASSQCFPRRPRPVAAVCSLTSIAPVALRAMFPPVHAPPLPHPSPLPSLWPQLPSASALRRDVLSRIFTDTLSLAPLTRALAHFPLPDTSSVATMSDSASSSLQADMADSADAITAQLLPPLLLPPALHLLAAPARPPAPRTHAFLEPSATMPAPTPPGLLAPQNIVFSFPFPDATSHPYVVALSVRSHAFLLAFAHHTHTMASLPLFPFDHAFIHAHSLALVNTHVDTALTHAAHIAHTLGLATADGTSPHRNPALFADVENMTPASAAQLLRVAIATHHPLPYHLTHAHAVTSFLSALALAHVLVERLVSLYGLPAHSITQATSAAPDTAAAVPSVANARVAAQALPVVGVDTATVWQVPGVVAAANTADTQLRVLCALAPQTQAVSGEGASPGNSTTESETETETDNSTEADIDVEVAKSRARGRGRAASGRGSRGGRGGVRGGTRGGSRGGKPSRLASGLADTTAARTPPPASAQAGLSSASVSASAIPAVAELHAIIDALHRATAEGDAALPTYPYRTASGVTVPAAQSTPLPADAPVDSPLPHLRALARTLLTSPAALLSYCLARQLATGLHRDHIALALVIDAPRIASEEETYADLPLVDISWLQALITMRMCLCYSPMQRGVVRALITAVTASPLCAAAALHAAQRLVGPAARPGALTTVLLCVMCEAVLSIHCATDVELMCTMVRIAEDKLVDADVGDVSALGGTRKRKAPTTSKTGKVSSAQPRGTATGKRGRKPKARLATRAVVSSSDDDSSSDSSDGPSSDDE